MKKLIFILTLALCAGAVQAQVKFETKSTDAVREMAVKQGKLVFIDLYADWCPPCRMMEREVFSRKDVGEFMDQRFVAAKYNTDKSKTPGMGTVFAGCMPYAIATMIAELAILAVWWALKLPLGPGVGMFIH